MENKDGTPIIEKPIPCSNCKDTNINWNPTNVLNAWIGKCPKCSRRFNYFNGMVISDIKVGISK